MQLWKLGCRWGTSTPLFYDFIKEKNIVIGWISKDYAVGDWLLITDGYTVLSFAEIIKERESILKYPQYQDEFEEFEIPFNENIFIYKAKYIHLKKEDRFNYPLQQGIVRVRKTEYVKQFNLLKEKYMTPNLNISELLENKKQIIFQGAPGTGKTYMAKDIAEQLIFNSISKDKSEQAKRLKANDQFKLIQFHPSYSYEDFVRGIEVKTENGQPEYITRNKVLGEFALSALKNIEDSEKDPVRLTQERSFENKLDQFKDLVRDVISEKSEYPIGSTTARIIEVTDTSFKYNYEGNRTIYFNLLFSDLIKMHNSGQSFERVKDVDDYELVMKGKGSYYYPLYNSIDELQDTTVLQEKVLKKKYVLIIDEINRANLPSVLGELIYALEYRGEKVESMYEVDGDNGLILPPNLYIIGTMNTADRSVGQIDYAIRRRFAFIDVLPKVLSDDPDFDIELFKTVSKFFIENIEEYINDPEKTVLKRSEWLSDEFLPEDVWIGHSYFIMKNGNRDVRLNYEIKPILKEYLKDGILKENVNGEDTKTKIYNL